MSAVTRQSWAEGGWGGGAGALHAAPYTANTPHHAHSHAPKEGTTG